MSQPEPGTDPVAPELPGTSTLPGTPDSEGWRKLHPLSPILRGGLFLLVLTGIIVVNLRDVLIRIFFGGGEPVPGDSGDITELYGFLAKNGLILLVIGGILAVLLLIVLFSWIGWKFRTFRITDDTVESRSGVIFKQHRRAPLDRVQSVNLQRPLLARVLGLTKLDVLTGGQGGKVELTYLGHRDAKVVRELILQLAAARRDGGQTQGVADRIVPAAAVSYDGTAYAPAADAFTERAHDFVDFDVDAEAVANNALVRVPVGRLLGSVALSWESVIAGMLIILALSWGIVSAVVGAIGGMGWLFASGGLSLLTLIPLILVMAALIFGQINKGFNFTLSKGRDAVRVGAGLTTTATDSIPFGRIHAIEARQPLFWRPFGWWRVRVTLAGHSLTEGGQSATQNLALPVGPVNDVVKVIETLVPGASHDLIEGLIGDGEGYTRAGARAGWVLWFARKRAGVRIDVPSSLEVTSDGAPAEDREATLRIRRGFLTRSLAIMPVVRAQSVQLRRPMVHYWLDLASIQAHTVLGPVNLQARGLALADARELFEDLAATVLRVQQSESDARAATRENASTAATKVHEQPAHEPVHAQPASVEEPELNEGETHGFPAG